MHAVVEWSFDEMSRAMREMEKKIFYKEIDSRMAICWIYTRVHSTDMTELDRIEPMISIVFAYDGTPIQFNE